MAIDVGRIADAAAARQSGVRAPRAETGCSISAPPGTRHSAEFRRSSAPTPTARASPSGAPGPARTSASRSSRPAGAGGQTLTIDSGQLAVAPGTRMTRSVLTLAIRSSRATQHTITLSKGAELEGVAVDGQADAAPLRKRWAPPGAADRAPQTELRDRLARTDALVGYLRAPAVDVGVPATNIVTDVQLTDAPRWMLWAAGPRLGPAVHIWSIVIVLVVLGWVLRRTRLTPLRWWDWTLLGIGMAQLPLQAAGVVALFLLALGWARASRLSDARSSTTCRRSRSSALR